MKLLAWPASLLIVFVSGGAFANGRYPIANQLVVAPDDPTELALRTTFGLVLSRDQGKTFTWVCEKAAGFVSNEDPPIEVSGDGSIFVASSQALNISHDGGCAWQTALDQLSIVDADVDRSQTKRAVAIAALYIDGGTSSGLEQTLDNGQTWNALGSSFPGLPATVALAPSDPKRIYASGTSTSDLTPLVSTSADDGAHWQSYPLQLDNITVPFLAAVDPTQPGVVYVRAPTSGGTDVLVMSSDFGAHWLSIFQAKGGLYGFALSPDGSQIAVGGPDDVLSVANTKDYQFTPVGSLKPLCLKWAEAGLYACADEANFGFSLGLSVDSGAHFTALFRKPELELQVCPTTTPAGLYCPQAWVGQKVVLGIDAGAQDSGTPPIGDAGSALTTDAGTPDASVVTMPPTRDASVVPVLPAPGQATSSACTFSRYRERGPVNRGAVWLGVGLGWAWALRRRGQARRRHAQ